jgi:hypothetical protein
MDNVNPLDGPGISICAAMRGALRTAARPFPDAAFTGHEAAEAIGSLVANEPTFDAAARAHAGAEL